MINKQHHHEDEELSDPIDDSLQIATHMGLIATFLASPAGLALTAASLATYGVYKSLSYFRVEDQRKYGMIEYYRDEITETPETLRVVELMNASLTPIEAHFYEVGAVLPMTVVTISPDETGYAEIQTGVLKSFSEYFLEDGTEPEFTVSIKVSGVVYNTELLSRRVHPDRAYVFLCLDRVFRKLADQGSVIANISASTIELRLYEVDDPMMIWPFMQFELGSGDEKFLDMNRKIYVRLFSREQNSLFSTNIATVEVDSAGSYEIHESSLDNLHLGNQLELSS